MGKHFLYLLLLSFSLSNAQVINKSNIWRESETRFIVCKSPKCVKDIQVVTNIYTLGKDTTIGGKAYSKINDTVYSENGQYIISSPGSIRQDGKKCYFRPGSLNELLIYDFSLQVGDKYSTYSQLYTVSKLDSIELKGQKYLTIQLVDKEDTLPENNDTLNWIEGIGAKEGFLYPINAKGLLLCFYNQSGLVYQNQSGYECKDIKVTSINLGSNPEFTIYPNPANEILTIKSSSVIRSVEIFDLCGKKIFSRYTYNNSIITLHLSYILKGVYVIKINNDIKKLIIN